MKLGFKRFIKRGQKGITLVELMVVMAILAVLSAIVFPAVSGTQETSKNSQVKQDASTVSAAVNDFYKDQPGAAVITPQVPAGSDTVAYGANETVSTRWPEQYIAGMALETPGTVSDSVNATYAIEFSNASVTDITLLGNDGIAVKAISLDAAGNPVVAVDATDADEANFVTHRQAIDIGLLVTDKYMPAVPKSFSDTSAGGFHNFLWLLRNTSSSIGHNDSRTVEVFRLVKVESTGTGSYTLTYQQTY